MGCNNKKLKDTCGPKKNSLCVEYTGIVPEGSELHEEGCLTVHEVIEDLYNSFEEVKEQIELGDISDDCIDYDEAENGNVTLTELVKKHHDLLCLMKDKLGITDCDENSNSGEGSEDTTTSGEVKLDLSEIDMKCLTDPCDNQIEDFKTLIQVLVDKVCELCDKTDTEEPDDTMDKNKTIL